VWGLLPINNSLNKKEVSDMQVSVETTSTVEYRMTVGVPSEHLKPEIQSRINSFARNTKINGFRHGKAPLQVIEQKYGLQIRKEVLGKVIQSSFSKALEQEKLRPIGEPFFELISDIGNLEQGLSYTATFEIYPEISTLHVDGLAIEKPIAQITEADIETMLYKLRLQRRRWNDVSRPAQNGDRVIIDLVSTKGGEPFKGNEAKQVAVILGENNFLSVEFDEKLLGASKGEDREFDLTFPQDSNDPNQLLSETLHFTVHVHSVSEPILPEIDAEFAKTFGVEDGSIETLRRDARQNMERELEYVVNGKIKQQILESLLKANPIEVPQILVADETQRLLKIRQQRQPYQNWHADMFEDEAVKRVKIGVLVGDLIKRHQIQASPDKIRQVIEKIAITYENPQKVVNDFYADSERMKEVESMVLEEEVVVWLLERAQITEKKMDFYTAIMEPNQAS
jgi:trigger factor